MRLNEETKVREVKMQNGLTHQRDLAISPYHKSNLYKILSSIKAQTPNDRNWKSKGQAAKVKNTNAKKHKKSKDVRYKYYGI
jgi:hypothetical protein